MKYRKKPIVIEAIRWTGKNFDEISNFIQNFHGHKKAYEDAEEGSIKTGEYYIRTLEGVMTATAGDWIIKGVNGEFYPCKSDIFEKSYDPEEYAKAYAPVPITSEELKQKIEEECEVRYPVKNHSTPSNSPYVISQKTFRHGCNFGYSLAAPVPGKEEVKVVRDIQYWLQKYNHILTNQRYRTSQHIIEIIEEMMSHYLHIELDPSTASNEDKTNEVEIESASEALCLIVGKADRGFWGSEDLKQSMLHEILEVAKKGYILSQSKPEDKAVQQAAKEYAGGKYVKNHMPKSWNDRYNAFLAGASFNSNKNEIQQAHDKST